MLTLYGRATSSNVQAVLWGLEELGVAYTRVDCGEGFCDLHTDAFRALNPHARIPVLVPDDAPPVFESMAILRYVASVYGGDGFWPDQPAARAEIDQWAEWAKVEVANRFTGPIFWRVVRTPQARWDRQAIREAVDRFEQEMATAERQLGRHAFIAGDAFSLADIPIGHVLYRYFDIEIERRDFPNLRAYYHRLTDRQAYRDAVMVSYEVLRDTI